MMCKRTVFSIFAALILCLSSVAYGQDETAATIVGQVLDSSGSVVPNATLVVTNTSTGQIRQVVTNANGAYSVYPLIPGPYTVAAELTGFKRSVVNVTLNTRDRRSIDITLEIGEASETVTVTDEPPLIQDSSVGQTLVSGNQVTELPLNNRNFIRLLETIPGVSSDLDDESNFGLTSRASVSINGQRRNSVNYVVDGVSNVDVGSNITLLSTPTVDSIQEFKVLSSNYTADVGRSGGGSVIITTKGGGNNFRGTLYEFARNDFFNANSFFNNRLGRRPDGSPVADTPRLRYHNFGGTISGPVILPWVLAYQDSDRHLYDGRNRTFFFFSHEQRRISRATSNATAVVPTAAQRTGDFSANLGNLICQNASGGFVTSASQTECTTAGTNPVTMFDTAGNLINIRQNQVFTPGNVPFAGNVVTPGFIDPRSLGLLQAYPLPNSAINGFTSSLSNINNTRQEVYRVDHSFNANHKIFGRYTMDTSNTTEAGGLFTGYVLPGVANTDTRVPGKVLAISYTAILSPSLINEFQFNYSANEISSVLMGRGRRSDYAGADQIAEYFPENNANAIPTIAGTGFSNIGALQGFSIEYANNGFKNVLTWTKGNHILKFGGEMTWEIKNENAGSNSQGTFGFSVLQSRGFVGAAPITATGVVTGHAFASYLMGRANTYSEAQTDFRVNQRFGRREFFVQDTWKVRPNLTLDLGVRYQYFPPPYDANDRIGTFNPDLYDPARSICANAACTALTSGSDRNNGFALAGSTSPFGRNINPADKNNFSPRVGLAWDPFSNGKTVIRAGYGFYYDQALIGIFEQAAFTTPAFNPNVSFTSTATDVITFDTVDAGTPPGTMPLVSHIAIANDFKTPEIQQWSIGVQRELFKNAVIDVSYVGTKGDLLIRRRNINFVSPQDVIDSGTVAGSSVRPFKGITSLTYIETTAKSRYNGLLSSFNYRLPKGFTITAAYTLSKNMTDSTNDRDAVDDPQNPFDVSSEYAEARTSRRHIFSGSYVYELPFFRKTDSTPARLLLSGWQVSGVTQIESGAPVPRVTVADTLSSTRGLYPNMIGDPNAGRAGTIDPVTGLPFIFDPTAFEPAALGTFGNAGRSFARLPGRNQTNLALMKQFYFNTERTFYLQIRAESFNLFNQTQFIGINTTLPTAGPLSNATFGRPTSTRLPREFQFGAKLYF